MFDIIEGDADLETLLMVVSAICVIIFVLVNNKKVRIISGIIFLLTFIPNPDRIPYRIGSIVVFGGITLLIKYLVERYKSNKEQ